MLNNRTTEDVSKLYIRLSLLQDYLSGFFKGTAETSTDLRA